MRLLFLIFLKINILIESKGINISRCEICGSTQTTCADCGDIFCSECTWHNCGEEHEAH